MKELVTSLQDGLRDKMASPVYGIFLITWVSINWNFVFSLFFLSEDKIWQATNGQLKNEYLLSKYFDLLSSDFYIMKLVLPVFFTWLLIWVFPKYISIPAYKKSEEYNYEKKFFKNGLELKLSSQEIQKVEKNEEKFEKEQKLVEAISKSEIDEYQKLKEHPIFKKIGQIVESIYDHNGRTNFYMNGVHRKVVDSDILGVMHSNGFINIEGLGNNEIIELTDKGKSLISKYLLEK